MNQYATFDKALEHTLLFEGGYSNDPKDRGGETKFGISKRSYPHLDIKNLTLEKAKEIYYQDYWLKMGCDKMPPIIAPKVFDVGVNMGTKWGVIMLQRAINTSLKSKTLDEDGLYGRKTQAILDCFTEEGLKKIARVYIPQVVWKRYMWIIAKNPSQIKYKNGWRNRAFAII